MKHKHTGELIPGWARCGNCKFIYPFYDKSKIRNWQCNQFTVLRKKIRDPHGLPCNEWEWDKLTPKQLTLNMI